MDDVEFERRKTAALAAIGQAYGTEGGEDSIDLFVAHHLEELPPAYWQEHLATATPDSAAVIGLLACRSSWGQDDLENFDFTLPDDVTDYVVSVHFDQQGEIDGISMES
ncbi:MAG: DUF2004 domain-containing protein [Pseudomonadota bacterium]|nr:DUF2004 domain-containing protein [Pseudomonadota bacterium]